MTKTTLVWAVLLSLSLAVAGWNQSRLVQLNNVMVQTKQTHDELRQSILSAKHFVHRQLGKKLTWSDLPRLNGDAAQKQDKELISKLILVLSDISCDACTDDETSFARTIAKNFGTDRVIAIVSAKDRKWAAGFARVNDVPFPVYFDRERVFAKANFLQEPAILLTDDRGRVLAANAPVPGRTEESVPFRETCTRYFESR